MIQTTISVLTTYRITRLSNEVNNGKESKRVLTTYRITRLSNFTELLLSEPVVLTTYRITRLSNSYIDTCAVDLRFNYLQNNKTLKRKD